MGVCIVPLWLFLASTMAAFAAPTGQVGLQVDGFSLPDTDGKRLSLAEHGNDRLVVLAFLGTECPLARLYAARLNELYGRFAAKGVAFLGICSNLQDSPEEIARFAREHHLEFPLLRDEGNAIADRLGAVRTPEVYLLDKDRVVRYWGRIDDQYGISYRRAAPRREDLAQAIEESLAGLPVSVPSLESVGCRIGRVPTKPAAQADSAPTVTWSKQISRLVQRRCQECHRPGDIAPFALTKYEEVKGWAETLCEVVDEGRMPPWYADPAHGDFENDARLTDEEKALFHAWVAGGCAEGDPAELPRPRAFPETWVTKPDQIFAVTTEPVVIPATGEPYFERFLVDPGFTEGKWVSRVECRPGARAAVHHFAVYMIRQSLDPNRDWHALLMDMMWGYTPGLTPLSLPEGMAKYVPAGARFVCEIHYVPSGAEQRDRSQFGLGYRDAKDVRQMVTTVLNASEDEAIEIPPRVPDFPIENIVTLDQTYSLVAMTAHMHYRGSAFLFEALYPNQQREVLLRIPNFDLEWQLVYKLREFKELPAGTRIRCVGTYDNSVGNPRNPNPDATVLGGDLLDNEMMNAFLVVAAPRPPEDKLPSARPDATEATRPSWSLAGPAAPAAKVDFLPDRPGVMRVHFAGPVPDEPASISLDNLPIAVKPRRFHQVAFRGRAAEPRTIVCRLVPSPGSPAELAFEKVFSLSPNWQTLRFDFETTGVPGRAHIQFLLGGSALPFELTDVYFDAANLSIKQSLQGTYEVAADPSQPTAGGPLSLFGADAGTSKVQVKEGVIRVVSSSERPGQPYRVMLVTAPFAVDTGGEVEVSFRARADAPRSMILAATGANDPWESVGLHRRLELESKWRPYRIRFFPTRTEPESWVQFLLGESRVPVEIADLKFGPAAPDEPGLVSSFDLMGPEAGKGKVLFGDDPGVTRIEPGGSGADPWRVIASGDPVPCGAGRGYSVSFRCRADQPRSLAVIFSQAHPPNGNLGLYQDVAVTPEWRTVSMDFQAKATDRGALQFALGSSAVPVELADVTIVPREWTLSQQPGASARLVYPKPGLARIEIAERGPGDNPYAVQLVRSPLKVAESGPCKLSFRAKVDRPATISCSLTETGPPFKNLGLFQECVLDTEWRAFEYAFEPTARGEASLYFNLGCAASVVELADIKLDGLTGVESMLPVLANSDTAAGEPSANSLGPLSPRFWLRAWTPAMKTNLANGIVVAQIAFVLCLVGLRRLERHWRARSERAIEEWEPASAGGRVAKDPNGSPEGTRRWPLQWLFVVATYAIFPLFYLGFVIAYSVDQGIFRGLVAMGLSVVLEYVLPFKPEWNRMGRQEFNDVLHLFFSALPGDQIGKLIAYSWLPYIVAVAPVFDEGRLWPSMLPFALQVAFALLLFELFIYTTHYLAHNTNLLWTFHRLHHSCERITMTKGFRRNLQESIIEATVSITVALLFGVPESVLVWVLGFQLSGTIFAHANIDMRTPAVLEKIFITPATHRIHHSVSKREGNSNYGNTLMVYDVLFGTYIDPNTHVLGPMGVHGNTVPESFWKQYICPFIWKKLDSDETKYPGGQ